jgi:hypothetical protein
VKNLLGLFFSFLILFPSLLSLEHFASHDHPTFDDSGIHFHQPELDCLTCDYIANNFTDYSADENLNIFIEYQKIDILNSYNISVGAQFISFKKNRAPPHFI